MLNKNLPFDQQFPLRLSYPSTDPPVSISIYKIDKYGQYLPISRREYLIPYKDIYTKPRLKSYLYNPVPESKKLKIYTQRFKNFLRNVKYYRDYKRNLRNNYNANYSLYTIEARNFNKSKINKGVTTITVNVPPLNPNQQYRFSLIRRDGSIVNSAIDIVNSIIDNKEDKANELFASINKANELNGEQNLNFTFDDFKRVITWSELDLIKKNSRTSVINENIYIIPSSNNSLDTNISMRLPFKFVLNGTNYIKGTFDFKNIIATNKFGSTTPFTKGKNWSNDAWKAGEKYKFYRITSYENRDDPKNGLPSTVAFISKDYLFNGNSLTPDNPKQVDDVGIVVRPPLIELVNNINVHLSTIDKLNSHNISNAINLLKDQLISFDCEKNGKINTIPFCEKKNDLYLVIDNLSTQKNSLDIVKGLIPINYTTDTDKIDEKSFEARIEIIKKSISLLDIVRQFSDLQYDKERDVLGNTNTSLFMGTGFSVRALVQLNFFKLSSDLKKYIEILEKSLEELNAINKDKLKFAGILNEYLDLTKKANNSTDGTTDVFDFKTRSKFRIVPDFGVILALPGAQWRDVRSSIEFAPYIGFHINFRSINKDIPFKLVRHKTVWHRLSFMAGLTLSSIKAENQREDLFGSKSLVTGIGFRLSNVGKIAIGGLWYKSLDANPLLDNKKTSVAPFIGASFDLELRDLFGGIVDLFK
ncbi:hypothetical protein GCM10027577_40840 [Spirosoma fluminis]